jgi:hypothetical protein
MSKRIALCLGMMLGLLPTGCRGFRPDVSVEGIPQACCTTADPKLEKFEGCRIPQRSCKARKGEKFWMRGAVACGPVDETACAGGRCCTYRQQYDPSINRPIENWAPPGFDEPTNNVTDPDAKPQHDVPEAGESTPAEGAVEQPPTAGSSEREAPAGEASEPTKAPGG